MIVLSPAHVAAVETAAESAFSALQARRDGHKQGKRAFDDSRLLAVQTQEARLYSTLANALQESGIIEAASEYLGRSARLVDVNPQINDATDTFWREIFADRAEKPPATAYFHRDSSGGDLKAIVYMSEVESANGPFSYVIGSHRLPRSGFDDFICEANDHNGFADTELDTRRRFAALPRLFQQKGSFGNDLPDNASVNSEILRAAWPITGPKGALVLFDTKGIHRGGMVESGERRVITCVIG